MRGAPDPRPAQRGEGGITPAYAGSTSSAPRSPRTTRDHPRICGEHWGAKTTERLQEGSSPHMRGAPARPPPHHVVAGIIPAYAGSTGACRSRGSRGWDHPRICGEHCLSNAMQAGSQGSSPHMRGAPCASSPRRPSTRDHPRICGEHSVSTSMSMSVRGSSPHMRGAQARHRGHRGQQGIIPAYAGSTPRERRPSVSSRDHPRICGEHTTARVRPLIIEGSSPHMRGARLELLARLRAGGIIPAYAGSTCCRMRHRWPLWDHPRICGEHRHTTPTVATVWGSSPHMRGAPHAGRRRAGPDGIIPAYAGSTTSRTGKWIWIGDHPRICGEHGSNCCIGCERVGSSPHMRGAPRFLCGLVGFTGIIPAYAGSTARASATRAARWDHPRICGEHWQDNIFQWRQVGSSPHMRGALSRQYALSALVGIIPAYAGSTGQQWTSSSRARDHPRICGEHTWADALPDMVRGSSPHMRGARLLARLLAWLARIIPAYAGSTGACRSRGSRDWDHPRICGEHDVLPSTSLAMEGSSPHMRGAHAPSPRAPLSVGIIPAYAGSTARQPVGVERLTGSSPHMRGAQPRADLLFYAQGIIPAYAGSTSAAAQTRGRRRDHPRICGEHLALQGHPRDGRGSSPHMRGALRSQRVSVLAIGIIPAYAGSTWSATRCRRARRDHPRICGEHDHDDDAVVVFEGSSPHMRGAPQRHNRPA